MPGTLLGTLLTTDIPPLPVLGHASFQCTASSDPFHSGWGPCYLKYVVGGRKFSRKIRG